MVLVSVLGTYPTVCAFLCVFVRCFFSSRCCACPLLQAVQTHCDGLACLQLWALLGALGALWGALGALWRRSGLSLGRSGRFKKHSEASIC